MHPEGNDGIRHRKEMGMSTAANPARGPKLTAGPTDERAWNRRAGGRMIFDSRR